jgi:hypothetical protein
MDSTLPHSRGLTGIVIGRLMDARAHRRFRDLAVVYWRKAMMIILSLVAALIAKYPLVVAAAHSPL